MFRCVAAAQGKKITCQRWDEKHIMPIMVIDPVPATSSSLPLPILTHRFGAGMRVLNKGIHFAIWVIKTSNAHSYEHYDVEEEGWRG